MSDAAFFREQAERCRRLAAASPDASISRPLEEMAADYHSRADALANDHQAAENDRPQPADIRELYTSSNGDVWFLIRDRQTRKVLVRHQANVHSGGKVTDTTIDEFLNLNGERPEKQALLRLRGVYFND